MSDWSDDLKNLWHALVAVPCPWPLEFAARREILEGVQDAVGGDELWISLCDLCFRCSEHSAQH